MEAGRDLFLGSSAQGHYQFEKQYPKKRVTFLYCRNHTEQDAQRASTAQHPSWLTDPEV